MKADKRQSISNGSYDFSYTVYNTTPPRNPEGAVLPPLMLLFPNHRAERLAGLDLGIIYGAPRQEGL